MFGEGEKVRFNKSSLLLYLVVLPAGSKLKNLTVISENSVNALIIQESNQEIKSKQPQV